MERIKVIDLLNKIANGEEVPKKIKYLGIEFSFQHNCIEYINDYGNCLIKNISSNSLNDEVEIIEDTPKEDKIIEKLSDELTYIKLVDDKTFRINIVHKINNIIDKVNGEDK